MGTPHRGSEGLASIGEVVARTARLILRTGSNTTILRALGVDSPELEVGRESFIRLWRQKDFQVKTFQEALPLSGIDVGALGEKVSPSLIRAGLVTGI